MKDQFFGNFITYENVKEKSLGKIFLNDWKNLLINHYTNLKFIEEQWIDQPGDNDFRASLGIKLKFTSDE